MVTLSKAKKTPAHALIPQIEKMKKYGRKFFLLAFHDPINNFFDEYQLG